MPAKILAVDDDPWILRMITALLEKRGYQVQTAADGAEALDRARAFRPDLIITDVMMPRLDGWAFVRTVRQTRELALVPVIFLTALAGEEDRLAGYRLGADDYLPKPFRFEELDLRIVSALRRADGVQASAAAALGSPASAPPATAAAPAQPRAVEAPPARAPGAATPPRPDGARRTPPPLPAVAAAPGGARLRPPTPPSPTDAPTRAGMRPAPPEERTPLPAASGVHGSLRQIGIGSLLTLLEMERKSGVLVVSRGADSAARLYLRDGAIIRAALDGRGEPRGADVVYALLAWKEGRFDFDARPVPGADEIGVSTTHLLLEGCRRLDEQSR